MVNGVKVIVFIGDRNKKTGKIYNGQANTKMQVRIVHGD